jgi:hypothetical protein
MSQLLEENLLFDDEIEEFEQDEEEEVDEIKVVWDQVDCNVCLGHMENGPFNNRWTNLSLYHHKIHVISPITWFAIEERTVCQISTTSVS